ncbi:DUF2243 domain-containing protein [Peribacillus sp. B-H-3]|uniref:DUF2243 domain-containing protein n=1 Tax=Peribacillus sp. B-H-3 TaxID=3400420 RepID=UPI003B01BFE7
MNKKRFLGFVAGYLTMNLFFHSIHAYAMGIKLESMGGRLGAVGTGIVILIILAIFIERVFSRSFFHGFLVSTGLFLSFDIVVFHWLFGLHRITNGPEANWLDPIFVVCGTITIFYGIRRERKIETGKDNILSQ